MPIQLWRTTSTASDDFIIAGAGPNTISGGDGDDLILGDSGTPFTYGTTSNPASPANIDSPTRWYTEENPFFGDASIPHTSLFVETEPGAGAYATVTVGAGETITIDVDFGMFPSVGTHTYVIITLVDSGEAIVAQNSYADGEVGGSGNNYSYSDPYLTYTNTTGTAQTYTIQFTEYAFTEGADDGGVFEGGETFIANISVTGHAASSPTVAGDDVLNGSLGYDWIAGQGGDDRLYGREGNDQLLGGSGNDLIDGGEGWADNAWYNDATGAVTLDLRVSGPQNTGGAGIDTLLGIEGLIGSNFSDTLTGNDVSNEIRGGGGSDAIDGREGSDTVFGGDGNDRIIGGDGNDYIVADRYDYAVWFDNRVFGQDGDDSIYSWLGDDELYGGYGNDVLNDAGGNDVLSGGPGVDTAEYYYVGGPVDVNLNVTAAQNTGGAGTDVITGIENLYGTSYGDTFTGNADANRLDGAYGDDLLIGADGNDVLVGGYGNDTMNGSSGVDTANYESIYEAVTVNLDIVGAQNTGAAGGMDTLINIENLSGSQYNDTLLGNAGPNLLDGSFGNDTLRGRAGNDTLVGNWGNDTLVGNTGNDTLDGGDGIDAASYAGEDVGVTVNLGIAGPQATGAGNDTLISIEDLIGTSFHDTLTGNGEANRINGGAGADRMTGRGGDDIYVVDNSGDVVIEGADGGNDTVVSSVAFNLGNNVERLTLTGSANVNAIGNSLGNVLTGNSGNNFLVGAGGNDTLTGGGGDDTYRFNTALSVSANVDEITDFSVADDTIELDNDIFAEAGAIGTLAAGAFHSGTVAADSSDRIIYDPATGRLWYDPDGNGAETAILFATVDPGLGLTNADFHIIG